MHNLRQRTEELRSLLLYRNKRAGTGSVCRVDFFLIPIL
jgi:hypothetical protein